MRRSGRGSRASGRALLEGRRSAGTSGEFVQSDRCILLQSSHTIRIGHTIALLLSEAPEAHSDSRCAGIDVVEQVLQNHLLLKRISLLLSDLQVTRYEFQFNSGAHGNMLQQFGFSCGVGEWLL